MRLRGSEAISPTAHYTSFVWGRNGLSHPALSTRQGRVMFETLRPAMMVSGALGGPTLEGYLLARHRAIDVLLRQAIERDGITQVLELACGLSPRGWRFRGEHPEIAYIEADLPDMAQRKRRSLARIAPPDPSHRVREVDVLRADGEGSLAALTAELDPDAGLAVITEGLLGYLDRRQVEGLWRRIAGELSRFRASRYITDLHLGGEAGAAVWVFRVGLGLFVGGQVQTRHYAQSADGESALRQAGFSQAAVRPAAEAIGAAADGRPGTRLAYVAYASA